MVYDNLVLYETRKSILVCVMTPWSDLIHHFEDDILVNLFQVMSISAIIQLSSNWLNGAFSETAAQKVLDSILPAFIAVILTKKQQLFHRIMSFSLRDFGNFFLQKS